MTREQYLNIFSKHLRVGQPERSSIIVEVENHLSALELGQDPSATLGSPLINAAKENRVQLGHLADRRVIAAIIFSVSFFALAIDLATKTGAIDGMPNYAADPWSPFIRGLAMAIPVVVAVYIGRAISRWHKPLIELGWMTAITFILAAPFEMLGTIVQASLYGQAVGISTLFTGLMMGLITTTLCCIVALVTLMVCAARPIYGRDRKRRLVDIGLHLVVGIVLIPFSLMLTELAFVPFDTIPIEYRPPLGHPARIINDFFEGGYGSLIVLALVLGIYIWFSVVRIKKAWGYK